jgi:FMN phosphatase YigB (HAD superfamily)
LKSEVIRAIIFDWGRTLYDSESQALFPQTEKVLKILSKQYILAIVSLASDGNIERRQQVLQAYDIKKYFTAIYFAQKDKDPLYTMALSTLALSPQEVAIVDDRMIRGIRWGNIHGAMTIWVKQGKFMYEEPNDETGMPTYTIRNLEEICSLSLLS